MKPFNLEAAQRGEEVVARNGWEARYGGYNPDAPEGLRVVFWLRTPNKLWLLKSFHENGTVYGSSFKDALDIFMKPKKKIIWCRVYIDSVGGVGILWRPEKDLLLNDYSECARRKWLDPEPWPHEVEV